MIFEKRMCNQNIFFVCKTASGCEGNSDIYNNISISHCQILGLVLQC